MSRDTTKNLGAFAKKGSIPWNKGMKYNDEMKSRLDTSGLSKIGFNRKHSEASKAKMSKSQTGLKRPKNGEINRQLTGEKARHWKGGITNSDRAERGRFRRELQTLILARDGYRCVKCNNKGELHVDHIKSWKDYPEHRFDIDNCRTLCVDCHYLVTFGKPKPATVKTWGRNLAQREKGE